jgi:hypothetical protein
MLMSHVAKYLGFIDAKKQEVKKHVYISSEVFTEAKIF